MKTNLISTRASLSRARGQAIHTLLAVAIFLEISIGARAALFQNGSFETGSIDNTTTTAAWTLTGTNTHLENDFGATEGTFGIAFNSGNAATGGTVSQTFDTVALQLYTVQFDWGNYATALENSDQRLSIQVRDGTSPSLGAQTINTGSATVNTTSGATILDNSSVLQIRDVTRSGSSITDPAPNAEFSAFSFSFTAQSTSSTIVFTDIFVGSAADSDSVLDNVRIEAVPEPGTALFGVALVGIAAVRRRRAAAL